jgi:PKD repeat protein
VIDGPAHTFVSSGTYTVSLTVTGAGGSDSVERSSCVTVRPAVAIVPGGGGLPRDLDGDGLFEDVNGNGRKDFGDSVVYFNRLARIGSNEPVEAFDLNRNGRIDFGDVVRLFIGL